MFVWAATSCIRFEHFQRSSFVGEADTFLIFKCSQGKARRQGTRPPYEWAMPELAFRGASLLKIVKDFVLHEALPDVGFLWPAVALQADELWQVTETTPWIVTKKMSRGRFLELMRGTLMDIGVDPAQAQVAGFNRLRRFLPTLGQICRLDPQDQQSLGSWVEVPSAGGPTPQRKSRATWSMGVHYAGQKVVHSGLLKAALSSASSSCGSSSSLSWPSRTRGCCPETHGPGRNSLWQMSASPRGWSRSSSPRCL